MNSQKLHPVARGPQAVDSNKGLSSEFEALKKMLSPVLEAKASATIPKVGTIVPPPSSLSSASLGQPPEVKDALPSVEGYETVMITGVPYFVPPNAGYKEYFKGLSVLPKNGQVLRKAASGEFSLDEGGSSIIKITSDRKVTIVAKR